MRGLLLQGLINGLAYSLLAVGLVLVFKAARFINFGHAQLGVIPAIILGRLVLDGGMSWWVAFPIAVALGITLGIVVEVVVLRRVGDDTRALLLTGIGVALLLQALTFVEALQPDGTRLLLEGYPVPFDVAVTVDEFVVRGQHILILTLAPASVIALALFLRLSRVGQAIRAVASNRDAARLAGVSVARVSIVVWGLAGCLSTMTAILQAPAQSTFQAAALGPDLLLRALAAAAMGGFTQLPTTFAAGLGLGIVEAGAHRATGDGSTGHLVVFAVVLAALVLRSKLIDRTQDERPLGPELRVRVPKGLETLWLVRRQRVLLGGIGLFLGVVLPLIPPLRAGGQRFALTVIVCYILVALSLTVLLGWAGQVSLGQFALLGVGAYTAAKLLPYGWSLPAAALASGAVGAAVAVLIGLPALRLGGLTLTATTLGFAVVAPAWLFTQPWIGSPSNISLEPAAIAGIGEFRSPISTYYVALGLLVLALLSLSALKRSAAGLRIVATRDNSEAMACFGYSPTTIKLTTFAISGFLAATAGTVWVAAWRNLSPDLIPADQSLAILAAPVIGGLGSLPGAVAGTAVIFGLPLLLGDALRSIFPNTIGFSLLLGGLAIVMTQIQFPGGLAEAARRAFEGLLEQIAHERGLASSVGQFGLAASDDAAQLPGGSDSSAAMREAPLAAPPGSPHTPRDRSLPVLTARGVTARFGGVTALDSVSIDVHSGAIVGLIGANGAGKTTLLNIITGISEPEQGSVSLAGQQLTGLPPQRRAHLGLSRSFQDARLFPRVTVRETIELSLGCGATAGTIASLLGAPWVGLLRNEAQVRVDQLLERFGLEQWADCPVGDLSTGTRRVCDLVAQLGTRPQMLLLDEPAAGLAQREAEQLPHLLRRIRDETGCAILIVEHDMPLLMDLAEHMYALDAGRVLASGSPQELREDPAVIAGYLGTDPTAIARSGDGATKAHGRKPRDGTSPARRGDRRRRR